jgi:hypothetical protein
VPLSRNVAIGPWFAAISSRAYRGREFMRGIRSGETTEAGSERKREPKKPLTGLQAFGIIVACFVCLIAAAVAVLALLTWLAWNSHQFGPRDLRYLLFVRGTLIERVGIIDARPDTLVYGGQGRDGNAPGYARADYISPVEANALLARFVERCGALGLHAQVREHRAGETVRSASCGRGAADEFPVHMSVDLDGPAEATRVGMMQETDDGL